jgi:hypothetical protein
VTRCRLGREEPGGELDPEDTLEPHASRDRFVLREQGDGHEVADERHRNP